MNFFDLCMACGRAIGRACNACWQLFLHMIKLTYRYWWIVLTLVALGIAAALYYTRHDNLTYKVSAVALINGGSIQQFEQAFLPLRSGNLLPGYSAIYPLLKSRTAMRFETFRVIDCLDDGVADYVDFKRKSSPTDTVKVQIGSIYSGTDVRDIQTIKNFESFTNQTEWSQYAKALNAQVDSLVVAPLSIDDSVVGKTVTLVGAASASGGEITITPVSMTIE